MGVDKRGWGFEYSTDSPSYTLTHSRSPPAAACHSVRETKRSSILQEDHTLPGDGASYPCITGLSEEVGSIGMCWGFVSEAERPLLENDTHLHIDIFSAAGYKKQVRPQFREADRVIHGLFECGSCDRM